MGRVERLSSEMKSGRTVKPLPKTRVDRVREMMRDSGTEPEGLSLPTLSDEPKGKGKGRRTENGRNRAAGIPSAHIQELKNRQRQAAADLDTEELDRINRELKGLRADAGKQTLGDRVSDAASAVLGGSGSSLANAAGMFGTLAHDPANNPKEIARMQKALDTGRLDDGKPVTEEMRKTIQEAIDRMRRELEEGVRLDAAGDFYRAADRMADTGARYQEKAKEGLGAVGSTVVDAAVSMGQSTIDGVVGGVTGLGMAPFVARAFGGAAQEARRAGADLNQQLTYGAAQAAKEYITEILFGLAVPQRLMGSAGAGSFDDAIEKGIRNVTERLAKTPGGQKALGGVLTWLAGGATEGLEEGIGSVLENTLINPNLRLWDPDKRTGQQKFEDALYDMLVGGVSGLMGVTNLMNYQPGAALSLPTLEDADTQKGPSPSTPEAMDAQRAPGAAQEPAQGVLQQGETQGTAQAETPLEGTQSVKKAVPGAGTTNKGETVQIVQRLQENIPQLSKERPVHTVSSDALETIKGATMAEKARTLFDGIKGFVTRRGFGEVEINSRSVKDDLSHGVGPAKAAVIPAIPDVIQSGVQIDFQENWKGRPYDGYVFAAPVVMDGETVYVAAVVKQTSKNRFYLHEVVDSNGGIIKIDSGERANQTSLDAIDGAGTQSPLPNQGSPTTVDEMQASPGQTSETSSGLTLNETISQPDGEVNGGKIQQSGGVNDGEEAGGTVPAEAGDGAGLYAGGQGRVAGPGSAQQGGGVEKSAGAKRRAEQSRLAVGRQSRVNALQTLPVSSREAGLSAGTEGRTIKIVPEEAYDDAMRSTAARYESHGYRVTYVIGLFTADTPVGAIPINGAVEGDRIFIQADNRQWTIDQIGDHELFHTMAADSPGLVQEVREKIMERYSEEEFGKVFAQYAKKYRGVYGESISEDGVLSEQEIRDIMEEIFADAYGDKNAFGAGAVKYQEAVEETLEDRGLGRRGRETDEATDRTTGPPRFSYGGKYANRADSESLAEAERLEMQGLGAEYIRQETGWFRGMDEKWRFEIDDSSMEYSRWGDMNREDRAEYARFRELEGKFIDGSITEAEQTELRDLIDQGHGSGRAEEQGLLKLSDFIRHDELFQNYPQLRKTGLVFRKFPGEVRGAYNPEQDIISISEDLRNAPEDTLIHEIQHAIQSAEGFAKGASPEYWDRNYYGAKRKKIDSVKQQIKELEQKLPKPTEPWTAEHDKISEEIEALEDRILDIENGAIQPIDLYRDTAGEIEARDVTSRRTYGKSERRRTAPDLGGPDTVFAEDADTESSTSTKAKFSMDETVEETKDLLAVHNMGEESLSWALEMGGLPMPSIAVIKADQGHSKYGPISIVFRKDTIDPQADKRNRVFGGDAWTQTNPEVEYPVNYEARRALEERIEELSQKIAGGMFSKGSAIAMLGVDDVSGMNRGELAKKLSRQDAVKAAYLADQGRTLETVMSEKPKQYDSFGNDALDLYVEKAGPQRLEQIYNALEEERRLLNQVELQEVREALKDYWRAKKTFSAPITEERLEKRVQKLDEYRGAKFVKNAWEYIHDSRGAELEPDVSATRTEMEKMADEASVRAWIEPQLEGILGDPGIRNTRDPFTPSGRSRSFEELHDPYTLEGIVKAMTDRQDRGAGVWYVDAKSVSSVATPEYKSVPEIKADSGRLQTMDQEAYDMSLRELDQKIEDFKSDIARNMSSVRETVGEALMEGATGKRTDAALKRVFVKYGLGLNPKQAAAVREIYQAAASLPTGYFEGKPERVVKPNEWAMAVVPDNLPPALRQKAEDSGLQLVEYKAGDDADRLRALNSDPGLRFSVDEDGETAEKSEEPRVERAPRSARLLEEFQGKPEESGDLFHPEGMSDEEYNVLNRKWKEQKKARRQTAKGEYQAELERKAAEAKARRMKNMSKEDFTGTPALQRLGVKVENSVGIYQNIRALVESDKAAKTVRKEMRKAEKRLHATEAERNFASGIAAGVYSQEDIPQTMDRDKVLELADYCWAERAVSSDVIRQQRSEINKALAEKMGTLFKDSDKFKPSRAVVLNNRTPERNMLHIFGDERGAEINAAIFDPVAVNEAERYRFANRMFDQVRTFQDSQGKQRPLTKEERALVQQVIEGRAVGEIVAGMEMSAAIQNAAENIRNGADAADEAKTFSLDREQQRLAVQYARWLEARERLDSGSVDRVKVENAVKKYGELFDQFYEGINDFLVAHGYEPIGFIKGYVPHLQPEENQNFLNKAFRSLGINADVTKLPASIAGQTADYRPNKKWNPYFLPRNSDITNYDIAEAFESYVEYMSDVLYHTDDIMRVRQAANYFRRTYAPEEIRNNLEWAEGLREGTVEEKANFLRDNDVISKTTAMSAADVNRMMDEYVEKLYKDISNTTKYSELVSYLDNYANILAGKQSMADRGWEYSGGRTVLNLGNKLTRAFGKAQVAGNLSSALNQTAQLPQIAAELGIKHTAKAMRDIASGKLRKGGWALESDFLTGKKGIDYLVSDASDMVLTAMFKPAELMDGMISTVAVRGRYLKEIQAGKTHREAMRAADDFGKKIMGSRMKGSRPLAFEAKNPVAQMLHIFQVEAVNQWDHVIQDLPQDFRLIEKDRGKNAAVRALAGVILKTLLAAFFLNRGSEELYGGTPAPFDLLGLSANFVASGEGLTTNQWLASVIDNGWEKITGERLFDTEKQDNESFDWAAAAADTGYNISNDIPYIRNAAGLLGLGDQTLPLPDLYGAGAGIVSAAAEDGLLSMETGKALGRAAAEVMPGGRQARKTAQGLEIVARGGKFKGYGDDARLQYPVDGDFFDVVQATMFGGSGLEETRRFYASGDTGLSAKQTQTYNSLVKDGADRKEVYETIQACRKIGGNKNLSSYERGVRERETIGDADLTDRQKLELYCGLTQSESQAEKLRAMMDAGLTWNQVADIYDEYAELEPENGKESVSNLQRYEAIANMPLSEGDKEAALEAVMTESAFARYEAAKGAGIKTSVYCDFLVELGGLSGDDRQKKAWGYIDGLPLDRKQKDALHLAAGYRESTLKDTPWH